jgi:NADH:ubiquinone oxidoreductase subunit 5 (subunit L)/multisubunit Na+/H+ antiporter MnhA subunit
MSRLFAALLSAAASLGCWFLYFTLYWPYRGRFNEEGRYLDEATQVVHHEQSGVLVFPAVAFMVLAVAFGAVWQSRRLAPTAGGAAKP